MSALNVCLPSIVFLVGSLIQIGIDVYHNLYPPALLKLVFAVGFAFVLNSICATGFEWVAWILVLVPLFCMSVITAVIVYIFGIDVLQGKVTYKMGDSSGSAVAPSPSPSPAPAPTPVPTPQSSPPLFTTNYAYFSNLFELPPRSKTSAPSPPPPPPSPPPPQPNTYHSFSSTYQFYFA